MSSEKERERGRAGGTYVLELVMVSPNDCLFPKTLFVVSFLDEVLFRLCQFGRMLRLPLLDARLHVRVGS